MAYEVPISSVPLLQDPPFVTYLVLAGAAAGRRLLILGKVSLKDVLPLEAALVSLGLGLGTLSLIPLVMNSMPFPFANAVRWSIWLAALPLLPDMVAVLRSAWRHRPGRDAFRDPFLRTGVVLLCVPLFVALCQALCPPTDSDGLGYHLAAPRRWLSEGGMTYLPTLLHTNSPMGVEMLFLWALAAWSETSAKLVHYTFGVLTLFGIGALVTRLATPRAALLAVFLFLFAMPRAAALPSFSIAYVDLGVAFEATASALALLTLSRTRDFRWAVVAVALAGFSASFKLTGLIIAALTVGAALCLIWQPGPASPWDGRKTKRLALRVATLLAVALLPVLPWLWRSWSMTGNPVYPFLPSIFVTRDWSPEAGAAFAGLMRDFIWAESNPHLNPARRAMLVTGVFAVAATLLTVGLLKSRTEERRALLAVSGLTALSGIAGAGLYFRYSLAVTPVLASLVAAQFASWLERSRFAIVITLAAIAFAGGQYAFRKTGSGDALPGARDAFLAAIGQTPRDVFLSRRLPNYRLWKYANANLAADSRILLSTSGASYYADFPCFITMAYHQTRFRLGVWEDFLEDVNREGITHLVSSPKLKGPRPGPNYLPARNEYAFAARLGDEFGELLHTEKNDRLYRLRRPVIEAAAKRSASAAAQP